MLFLGYWLFLLLLKHFIYLYDLIFEFPVPFFEFLDIFGPELTHQYLISYESLSFSLRLRRLVRGVSRN